MELMTSTHPEKVRKWGEQTITVTPPSKLRIQITGTDAQIILDEAPPAGKVWSVFIRVEAAETDQ